MDDPRAAHRNVGLSRYCVRVVTPWSAEQVASAAPDAASVAAARKLAASGSWSGTGACAEPAVVFGECKGSGATPYVAVVDLSGPAWSCSCPSRKIPCKHVLALLLLWSAGSVTEVGEPSAAAAAWLEKRSARAEKAATRAATPARAPSEATLVRRAERISAGLDELGAWLRDQVASGVSVPQGGDVERAAARLVDAQAPALAERLRRLHIRSDDASWPGALLEQLGLVHLLATAHPRAAALPGGLGAVVRRRVGEPTRTADVLAAPPLRDVWDVVATHTDETTRPATHRTHLRGRTLGRSFYLVETGRRTGTAPIPGTSLDADLHPHPAAPSRALLGTLHASAVPLDSAPHADPARDLPRLWSAAVAADPWAERQPVVLADALVRPGGDGTWVVDLGEEALALHGATAARMCVAVAGGRPTTLVADCTPRGLEPRALWDGRRLVAV